MLVTYPNITYFCFHITAEKKPVLKPETFSSLFSVLHAVCCVTFKSKEFSEERRSTKFLCIGFRQRGTTFLESYFSDEAAAKLCIKASVGFFFGCFFLNC